VKEMKQQSLFALCFSKSDAMSPSLSIVYGIYRKMKDINNQPMHDVFMYPHSSIIDLLIYCLGLKRAAADLPVGRPGLEPTIAGEPMEPLLTPPLKFSAMGDDRRVRERRVWSIWRMKMKSVQRPLGLLCWPWPKFISSAEAQM